ncbi:DUF3696 domain-containing protein [Capnocytophaga cynodegmi]|uniref:DUF3696 domain-containing protein n=1 Tax=Capnocytophaga cynodegmi TaxID=28189 RepID=UPI001AD10D75|nr:DUF3696 domain-containing protein [Capnocytophaga cynodegmi]GIM54037.1 hypothetical protein CAPN005_06840 [Capnocytophaga cynodegmi]
MKLNIENFKCFSKVEVPIKYLTILAGSNGSGKSSVIQSLLLLRRAIENCTNLKEGQYNLNNINNSNVELNDVYCLGLGNSGNLVDSSEEINIKLFEEKQELYIKFDTNKGFELFITPKFLKKSYENNPLLYKEFYYLNAERIGPRISQGLKSYDFPNVGFQGELTAQIIGDIDKNFDFKVDENRILADEKYEKGVRFHQRINSWLDYILGGVTIDSHQDDKTHTARIEVENSFTKGKPIFPTNTGFGISYCLPIVVTCLLAKKDRFVIIENPEAHLHPSAQSKMGYFLGVMANSGLRIIIETHSDHIINGVQIAVVKKKINHDKVIINYFEKDTDQLKINPISTNDKGELSEWPKGFFDQTQIDFSELIKLRKNV